MTDDTFSLYDLRVEWLEGDKPCWCGAKAGDCFYLRGEHLEFPESQTWSIYTQLSREKPVSTIGCQQIILLRALIQIVDQDLGSIGCVGEHFLTLKQQLIRFLRKVSNEH